MCVCVSNQLNTTNTRHVEHTSPFVCDALAVYSCAAILREALVKWGVSAERNGPRMGRSSGDLSGEWNLQADANLSAFMDFSDFYVLPESPLPAMWKMTEQTFIDSYVLSNPLLVSCSQLTLAQLVLSMKE